MKGDNINDTRKTHLSLQNIPGLDGLRTLAISLVLITHTWTRTFKESKLTLIDKLYFILADFGVSGVDLFFVISGFLISIILIINKEKPKKYSYFYIRRITRIWPPYILFISVLYIVINSTHSSLYVTSVNFLNSNKWWLWLHLTNILILLKGAPPFNTTILWSLAIEEQFYLLWPFIIYSFKLQNIIKACIIYLIISSLIRWYITTNYSIDLNVFTPTRLDGFVVGGLLGITYYMGFEIWKRIKNLIIMLFILSSTYMLIIMLNNHGFLYHGFYFITFGYLAISVFCGSILYYCVNVSHSSFLYKIFTYKPVKLIAKHSYVIYLIHHPLCWLLLNLTNINQFLRLFYNNFIAQLVYFIIIYTLSFTFSFIIWHLYEKHFFKLRSFFK